MQERSNASAWETERLHLRSPSLDDIDAIIAYVTENREHLAPWEPRRGPAYFTRAHLEPVVAAQIDRIHEGERASWLIREQGAAESTDPIVGICTLDPISRGPFQNGVLGYSLAARVVGRGYMSEAIRSVIARAFGPLDLHRIEANVRPENERSLALLERLGFVREGFSPRYLHIDGDWRDHIRTALLRDVAPGSGSS